MDSYCHIFNNKLIPLIKDDTNIEEDEIDKSTGDILKEDDFKFLFEDDIDNVDELPIDNLYNEKVFKQKNKKEQRQINNNDQNNRSYNSIDNLFRYSIFNNNNNFYNVNNEIHYHKNIFLDGSILFNNNQLYINPLQVYINSNSIDTFNNINNINNKYILKDNFIKSFFFIFSNKYNNNFDFLLNQTFKQYYNNDLNCLFQLFSHSEVNNFFNLINSNSFLFFTNQFGNYISQIFLNYISKTQRMIIWNTISTSIDLYSKNKYSSHCIQKLILLSSLSDSDEQKRISLIFVDKLNLLINDKMSIHVISKILVSFQYKSKIFIIKYLYKNFLDLCLHSKGVCLIKSFAFSLINESEMIKMKFIKKVEANLSKLINHKYAHYLILFLIDKWTKNDIQGIYNFVIEREKELANSLYSSRVKLKLNKKSM